MNAQEFAKVELSAEVAMLSSHYRQEDDPERRAFERLQGRYFDELSLPEALAFEPQADEILLKIERDTREAWNLFRQGDESECCLTLAAVISTMDQVRNKAARIMAEADIEKLKEEVEREREFDRALFHGEFMDWDAKIFGRAA